MPQIREKFQGTDDAILSKNIGLVIAQARKQNGITQAELAHRLDVTQGIICAYEQGRRRIPITQFIKIARALGIEPGKLLDNDFGDEREPKKRSRRFLKRLDEIENLSDYEQRVLARTIDAFLSQKKTA